MSKIIKISLRCRKKKSTYNYGTLLWAEYRGNKSPGFGAASKGFHHLKKKNKKGRQVQEISRECMGVGFQTLLRKFGADTIAKRYIYTNLLLLLNDVVACSNQLFIVDLTAIN